MCGSWWSSYRYSLVKISFQLDDCRRLKSTALRVTCRASLLSSFIQFGSSMSEHSVSSFNFYSRRGVPSQEAELAAFAAAVRKDGLDIFIELALYDSSSDCCTFTFIDGVGPYDEISEKILAIATQTITQFEWFGTIHHGNGYSEEDENPWFKDKVHQVIPSSLTAFGIHLESRQGQAIELADMLKFAQRLAWHGLESVVEEVEYDSKATICSFKFSPGFVVEDPRAAQILEIALQTLSHFDWFGDERFGLDLAEQE